MKHHLTMRASSDPEFLNRHCKKINHSEEDVSLTLSSKELCRI